MLTCSTLNVYCLLPYVWHDLQSGHHKMHVPRDVPCETLHVPEIEGMHTNLLQQQQSKHASATGSQSKSMKSIFRTRPEVNS